MREQIERLSQNHTAGSQEARKFLREVHGIVRDLFRPNLAIYWVDFLVTMTVAYAAFGPCVWASRYSLAQSAAFVVCGLALYRGVVFTHELAHHPGATFRLFHCVWNLLCGIPLLMPSFLYSDHKSHHSLHSYGTAGDAEYLFLRHSRYKAVLFVLLSLAYPVLGAVRFLFLTPAALLSPAIDRRVWTYASSLYIMNADYRREYDSSAHTAARWMQEIACCLWAWWLVRLLLMGTVPLQVMVKACLVFVFWIAMNQLRTLTAHRYSSDGKAVSYVGQTMDTNTFPRGKLLPEVWAPLGLRYHCLHHLLPSLPYHALGEAHRRLMKHLPPDSVYSQSLQPGFWTALQQTLRRGSDAAPLTAAAP